MNSNELTRDEMTTLRNAFYAMPYAGNHSDTAAEVVYGMHEATYRDEAGNVWKFGHDASWDNVEVYTFNGKDLY